MNHIVCNMSNIYMNNGVRLNKQDEEVIFYCVKYVILSILFLWTCIDKLSMWIVFYYCYGKIDRLCRGNHFMINT
jgi:hypothetical protein